MPSRDDHSQTNGNDNSRRDRDRRRREERDNPRTSRTSRRSDTQQRTTSQGQSSLASYEPGEAEEIFLEVEINTDEILQRAAAAEAQYGGRLQTILTQHGSLDDNGRLVVQTPQESAAAALADLANWTADGYYIGPNFSPYTEQLIELYYSQSAGTSQQDSQQFSQNDTAPQGGH